MALSLAAATADAAALTRSSIWRGECTMHCADMFDPVCTSGGTQYQNPCFAFCHNMPEFKKGACAEPVQVGTAASNATAVNATFMTAHNVIDIADGGIPVLMGSVGLSVAS